MGRVLLPEQLLRAVLPGRAEGAIPGAMQLREALLLPVLLHMPFHLSAQTPLSRQLLLVLQEALFWPGLPLYSVPTPFAQQLGNMTLISSLSDSWDHCDFVSAMRINFASNLRSHETVCSTED